MPGGWPWQGGGGVPGGGCRSARGGGQVPIRASGPTGAWVARRGAGAARAGRPRRRADPRCRLQPPWPATAGQGPPSGPKAPINQLVPRRAAQRRWAAHGTANGPTRRPCCPSAARHTAAGRQVPTSTPPSTSIPPPSRTDCGRWDPLDAAPALVEPAPAPAAPPSPLKQLPMAGWWAGLGGRACAWDGSGAGEGLYCGCGGRALRWLLRPALEPGRAAVAGPGPAPPGPLRPPGSRHSRGHTAEPFRGRKEGEAGVKDGAARCGEGGRGRRLWPLTRADALPARPLRLRPLPTL